MKNKIYQKYAFVAIKLAVTLVAIGYIAYIVFTRPGFFSSTYEGLQRAFSSRSGFLILMATLALLPLNISLEAFKWQYLASKVDKIQFGAALKGVVSGFTLGFITPHGIGDYLARVYFIDSEKKSEAASAVFVSRMAQFYISVFYGLLGFYITSRFEPFTTGFFNLNILLLLAFFCLLSLLLLLNFGWLTDFLAKQPRLKFMVKYLHAISDYTLIDFVVAFILALCRYAVFCLQYLLLLSLFGVDVYNVLVISAIWLVFFVKSVFPALNFLNDLGLREASALFFLGKVGVDAAHILPASLMLWGINILLPSLAGIGIVVAAKYRRLV